jgi:hypothetical protein
MGYGCGCIALLFVEEDGTRIMTYDRLWIGCLSSGMSVCSLKAGYRRYGTDCASPRSRSFEEIDVRHA